LKLTGAGNLGIGTTSPSAPLEIVSSTLDTLNINFTNTKAAGQGDTYLNLGKAANGNSNGIQFKTGGTQKWIIGTGITAIDDNFKIYNPTYGALLTINQSTGVLSLANALPVTSGGTGTTTPSIVAGTNVTVSGTWPNQTISSSGTGGAGTETFNAFLLMGA
jgi:hypothetical protein